MSIASAKATPVTVDVICPLRDEALYLPALLLGIKEQDYPDIQHIFLVVAPSSDDTLELCSQAAAQDHRMVVLNNLEATSPCAMNLALEYSRADTWVRIDGHVKIEADLISILHAELLSTGAACVGPTLRAGFLTPVQEAVGLAMSSKLGVGDAKFRTGSYDGPVDAVAFGLYDSRVTRVVGLFNPVMKRNQDDEYNTRIRRRGGELWLTSKASVTYYPRASLNRLFDQYRQYGFWRAVGVFGFGNELRVRQVVPSAFVVALGGSLCLAPRSSGPLKCLTAAYAGLLVTQAASVRPQASSSAVALVSSVAVACMHLSYGVGFLNGCLRTSTVVKRP